MDCGTDSTDKTVIDRHIPRINQADSDGYTPLQLDGVREQPMRPTVAVEVRAPSGELAGSDPITQRATMLAQKSVLRPTCSFSLQHCDPNKHRQNPVRSVRFATRTRSRTFMFRTLAQSRRAGILTNDAKHVPSLAR